MYRAVFRCIKVKLNINLHNFGFILIFCFQQNKESGEGIPETIQLKVGGPYLRHIVFIHVRLDEEIHKLKLIYSMKVVR